MPAKFITEKPCAHCHEIKASEHFAKCLTARDGLQSWCRACCNSQQRAKYQRKRPSPPPAGMKRCSRCKQVKETSGFPKDSSEQDGLHCQCKECSAQTTREYRKRHPDRVKEANRRNCAKQKTEGYAFYHEHWERYRDHALRVRYGIDFATYDKMRAAQNGLCAICGHHKKLDVDHDHKTGKVRGLLCRSCNIGIGYLKESPELLRSAADYLDATANGMESAPSNTAGAPVPSFPPTALTVVIQ